MTVIQRIAKANLVRARPFERTTLFTTKRSRKFTCSPMAQGRSQLRLVLDFDGTITTDDTTAVIGARCLSKARELARADVEEGELPKPMQHYSEQYMREYREWKESSEAPKRTTVDEEVAYLSQSRGVEQNSYLRVKNAVFDVPGVREKLEGDEATRNEFMTVAGREAIRSGEVHIRYPHALRDLITTAEREGNSWGIVSVSWSRRFILGALIEAGLVKEDQGERFVSRIKCNEILAPDYLHDEGNLNIICSARDKLNTLNNLLTEWGKLRGSQEGQNQPASSSDKRVITIYIGDSSTDIGCLAGPAIGIYVLKGEPDDDSVVQTLKGLGIQCLRIKDVRSDGQAMIKSPPVVYLVQGFEEVNELLASLLNEPE